jgi:hypothetical protein
VNGTAVYGTNQINNQVLQNVYGCGRKDDTTIYVSSDSFALSTVSTVAQNQTNQNWTNFYTRGFAMVNSTELFSVYQNLLYYNNTPYANLTLNGCSLLYGYGLTWQDGKTYVIYSRPYTTTIRRIGIVDLTTGYVQPSCVNLTQSFNALTFDSSGHLWALVGNAGPSTIYNISKAPCVLKGNATCGTFGSLKGTEFLGDGSRFGNPTKMSADGTTIIAAAVDFLTSTHYAIVSRFYQNDWYRLGNTIDQPMFSVAISADGNIIATGDKTSNTSKVYQIQNCSWVQIGSDIMGGGYAMSLSPDGLTLASSYINEAVVNDTVGITYIYDWNGTQWVLRGNPIRGVNSYDYSGFDISLYGKNRIAIGVIEFTGIGRTEIYEWSGTAWVQLGASIIGENLADNSGNSVSLQNNTVAIGAWQNDGNGTDSGSTRIYEWNGTTWNKLGQDIDGEFANDYSGTTVSLSSNGRSVAIGALFNPVATENGQVRIYDYNGTVWIQRGFDLDGGSFTQSGICSMSSDSTTVAVGGPRRVGGGSVKVYCISSPV